MGLEKFPGNILTYYGTRKLERLQNWFPGVSVGVEIESGGKERVYGKELKSWKTTEPSDS